MKDKKPTLTNTANTKLLKEAFNGDLDLMLFYVTWVKNAMNAQAAYKEIHPDVTDASAAVLGSRLLKKVNQELVLKAYGLDHEAYYLQLADGLKANKSDMTGQVYPDHRTRREYHKVLGVQLGIESDKPTVGIVNTGEMTLEFTGGE